MKKKFIIAATERRPGQDLNVPIYHDLNNWNLVPNTVSHKIERHIRYIKLDKKNYQVELWDTYCPVERGAFGRQRSVLRARYTLRRFRTKAGEVKLLPIGRCEQYHWSSGKISKLKIYDNDGVTELKNVELTTDGNLAVYEDMTRGEFNRRIVHIATNGGTRVITRWRNKYSDKNSGGWGQGLTVRKTEDGSPLLDNGNFIEVGYSNLDKHKTYEVRCVAGRRHGVLKKFNKFGRVIDEAYFHHGTELPRWVASKPEDVTVEEILDENNTEIRRAMLELQGFEVFMARCEAKGMVKIVDQDKDEKVGTLIQISLPKLGFGRVSQKDMLDINRVMMLKVKDGTLPKHYVLRVPPNMKTARQANAWTWSKTAEEYAPSIER